MLLLVLSQSAVFGGNDFATQIREIGISGTGEGQFQNPYGLAVDEVRGWIYVADTGNNKIRKFNLFGEYQNSFGSSGTGDGQFLHPQGGGVDSTTGDIYVVDTVNQRIQKFDINYTFLLKFGSSGSGDGQFNLPRDIAIDSGGNVYVCDSGNDRISKFNSSGVFLTNISQGSLLLDPHGIDVDSAGNIYVADSENHRIVKFAPDGTLLMAFGSFGTGPGEFHFPHDVAIDREGNIFVADTDNHRIQKFNAIGVYLNSFGTFLDFRSPQKLAIDSNDNLYVIDSGSDKLSIYNVSIYIDNVFAAPTPFSPDGDGFGDTTFIHYTIPEPAEITITIYDKESNLVRKLIDGMQKLTAENQEEWDGKDDSGAFVNAGTYTCKIDAVNAAKYHAPQRSCLATIHYPTGQICGTVTDGANPVSGATVSDGTRWTLTDGDGRYTISNVPVGTYTVTASKSGYTTESHEVTLIIEGEIVTGVNFILTSTAPQPGSISGTVTDGASPLEGVTVSDGTRSDLTDVNGSYTIEQVPAGTYTVTTSKAGYKTASTIVTVGQGQTVTGVDFVLEESNEPDIRVAPTSLEFRVRPGKGTKSSSSVKGLSTSAPSGTTVESSYPQPLKGKVIPGEYIVKFKKGIADDIQQNVLGKIRGVLLLKKNKIHNACLIRHLEVTTEVLTTAKSKPDELQRVEAKLAEFELAVSNLAASESDTIEYIESNREVYALGPGISSPNDLYFGNQWGLHKIDAPQAWDIEAGEKSVVVGVIDSGVDYIHEDLAANYIEGGYDFIDDDNDPYPTADGIDNDGDGLIDEGVDHGTHVAGIVAAVTNNAKGIAGVAQVSILAERVLNSDGVGTSFEVVDGIDHAVAHGAKIINLSLGGGGTSLERKACEDAWGNGCIIVAAAGNDYGGPVIYPAAYPTVIAVSATDQTDNIASFSNVGPEIELAAPGVSILSTVIGDIYETKSGTSMAAPHVAGVAALVWSVNPDLDNGQVRSILQDSADDLGPEGRDNSFGYGRINAYKAVMKAGGLYQSKIITVYNDGGIDLAVTDIANTYAWLSVNKTSFTVTPGGSDDILVSAVAANLSEGTYNDIIEIFSNDPNENPYQIPVTVLVSENFPPTISRLPDITLSEGTSLDNAIDLWEYTVDAETNNNDLIFTISNNSDPNCGISIDSNRYIDINPTANWNALSNVTVRVTDPGGLWDEDTFTVTMLPWDNFDDDRRGIMWWLSEDDHENAWMVEDVNRLNVRATGEVNDLVAFYVANGWSFDVNEDFAVEVDFHYSDISRRDAWVGINIGDDVNYVSISAGSDSNGSYYYYETVVDGNMIFERQPRDLTDGTLYIWYDANANNLYLSHIGYGSENAYVWQTIPNPLRPQWGSSVHVAIGGGSDAVVLDSGKAYLDNFKVTRGTLLGWPPIIPHDLQINISIDNYWMYQNLPSSTASTLSAAVSVISDPAGNDSYSYRWEFILPADVSISPLTINGGDSNDSFWTFAAPSCDQPSGLSDSGQPFKIRVTVIGNSYGNSTTAELQFGIALLGDINNDTVVDVADRSIVNAFWRTGSAGGFSLRDCDVNYDGVVDIADRSITNAVWRGTLGKNSISSPCPFR